MGSPKDTLNSEDSIIACLTENLRTAPSRYGVGDDCALIEGGAVITQDTMIEGIHFDNKLSAEDIGWKLVAINASDIAAMGRMPSWATLSISLPKDTELEWLKAFNQGLKNACRKWSIQLCGGDTTASPGPIVLSMTMGSARGGKPIWRSGAKPGDAIWVTGYLGEAAAGFYEKNNPPGLDALRRPNPPVLFGSKLGSADIATSMIDLSDGLYSDLTALCKASGVGAVVYPDKLPIGPACSIVRDPLPYQTSFGEDYELLFTTLPTMEIIIQRYARESSIQFHQIGKIRANPMVELKGKEWPKPLFTHFSN